jgi:hypothetical protein
MPGDSAHECPVGGCDKDVSYSMLMCRPHWYSVPKPLRNALYRAWNYGQGAGSVEHNSAMERCISAAERAE